MVTLTRLHWILIVAVAIIATIGVSIGIWQAVVAGNDEKITVLTTPTTSQSTSIANTTSPLTSTTGTSTSTLVYTFEFCGQNHMVLVNNGRYPKADPAFTASYKGPIKLTTGVATKYNCCNLCYNNGPCYLFEYKNTTGDCMEYGINGNSSTYNQLVALSLIIIDGAYSSGFYIRT